MRIYPNSTSNEVYLGACLRAVHDCVAFECAKTVTHRVQTLLVVVIAAVDNPTIRLQVYHL